MSRHIPTLLLTLSLLSLNLSATADDPAPGKQVEQSLQVSDDLTVPYLVYLPKDYGEADKTWPLMLFLHGRGESYGPLGLVKKWGPPRIVERGEDLPFIIVSPQCPGKESWSQPKQQGGLVALLDHISKQYQVDTDRVYLTGLSMGGFGSWRLAADHPHRFAAVAPVCGGGKTEDAQTLAPLPVWVFHGDKDRAVPFQRSQEMVDAIRKAGGAKIRFTSLEDVGHNCWSAAYATPELYDWMLQHRVSDRK